MAVMLKNAAVKSVNKGQSSAFYSGENNPVLLALDHEIKSFVNNMKKRTSSGHSAKESLSRSADTLFDLWNRYEHKLPKTVFQSKLLEMGHFLISVREYNLALWQCFERYLKSFGDVNLDEISEVQSFKSTFFPKGFDTEDAGYTFQALMGRSICTYEGVKLVDPKLQNSHSVNKSITILRFLRLITQVILPKESLCWIVYNGTIHIYTIARHLMTKGHSAYVLEFLLWAAMCMESSVPLLGVRYLKWRATIYAAVCHCYYDCKAGQHAEAFARRAISKINELSQLENQSSNPESKEVEDSFRQATIKMAIMIYKRTVFETRRKPKGLLRPKTRANLKDAVTLPWPRTQSERLLIEMFEGGAAQMLCLLETLTDSNRRTLLSAPPAGEAEVELLDVFAELFMAVQELISGGGNQNPVGSEYEIEFSEDVSGFGGVCKEVSLLKLATEGSDGIPLSVVVKIVKLAYCYEQWDLFDALLLNTLTAIKELNDPFYGPDERALEILRTYDSVVPRAKQRRLFTNEDEEEVMMSEAPTSPEKGRSGSSLQEDPLELAEVILSIINGPFTQEQVDIDMVVDATLFLWTKCKSVFQKFQTGSTDNPKYLQKMDNPGKWVYMLDIIHQALGWSGLSSIDPALTAEVVLRLSLVFEASSILELKRDIRSAVGRSIPSRGIEDEETTILSTVKADTRLSQDGSAFHSHSELSMSHGGSSQQSIFSATALHQGVHEQLLQARSILESGLDNVAVARTVVALTDGKSIADIDWVKEFNPEIFAPVGAHEDFCASPAFEREESTATRRDSSVADAPKCTEDPLAGSDGTAVLNTVRDLHMELMFMYHRICVKLADFERVSTTKGKESKTPVQDKELVMLRIHERLRHNQVPPWWLPFYWKPESRQTVRPGADAFEELVQRTRGNGLSKALLYMQRAMSLHMNVRLQNIKEQLLRDAISILRRVESEEKRLYVENVLHSDAVPTKVPPPPILLCRTEVSAILKPAEFLPTSGEEVAWYRIFARNASGSNVKVRMSDYSLPGTGEQTPSFRCEFVVRGLTPGEKYVFAVSAYTKNGELIGKGIGQSTKPILASHPMPVLMGWAYLSLISYQTGCHDICEEACQVLWSHFVAKPLPPQGTNYKTSARRDFKLTLHRLNPRIVSKTSPVLLRLFLTSIFIRVDIAVRRGDLFCTKLCDEGPLLPGQIRRLKQCEVMIVAMQLAGWLNENNLALQAAVQCYGLLAPLLHFKIPCIAITQVLERCSAVLQEVPAHIRLKRATTIAEGLHHMTACLTFQVAKVMRNWGQRALASNLNESGRRLLAVDPLNKDAAATTTDGGADTTTETGSLTLAALKKRKSKKGGAVSGKEDSYSTGNEELKALEAHMLRLSKQAQGEHELNGNEDPSILHAYIAYLPSKIAYKEVMKFKRRARYLEFLTQCVQKALSESIFDLALEWCEDTVQWLIKRNENIMGTKTTIGKQPGALTVIGDDPKKFQAALVEYAKERPSNLLPKLDPKLLRAVERERDSNTNSQVHNSEESRLSPGSKDKQKSDKGEKTKSIRSKKPKYKAIGVTSAMSDVQRVAQEELEIRALDILSLYFIDAMNQSNRRKKLRKISADELPWRAQLNILEGVSQFGVFMKRVELREKMIGGPAHTYLYRTSFLEDDWFGLETSGTLVANFTNTPSRMATRLGLRSDKMSENSTTQEKASGIDLAAAAATGTLDIEDSPRTNRSEVTGSPVRQKASKKKKAKEEDVMLNREDAVEMLKKCFSYLKRAVVLAHRGRHWTLLQNACRALWNVAHTALSRAHSPNKTGSGTFMDVTTLRSILWQPFYTAADCLLDMLVNLQIQAPRGKAVDPGIQSWMGKSQDEKGGAGLRFDPQLDEVNSVDVRWIRRVVLRVVQLLQYQQKWERLVDLIMRFNAVSDERYTETVSPLMLQAQRKLLDRIAQYDGPSAPQPHFLRAEKEAQSSITPKMYTQLQLKVRLPDDAVSDINPGAHIDPAGHNVYSGGLRALKLCRVPLDVSSTLQSLRSALNKSEYTARALQHSRRLLVLYLAGQSTMCWSAPSPASFSHSPSHVDFVTNTARPQASVPADLAHEDFPSEDDVTYAPLPKGQISVVIHSYQKTIELLLAGNQRDLAAEALRELANLHFHMGDSRAAYKCWAEALDLLLQIPDALRRWREVFSGEDPAAQMLKRCGLWGCMLAGMICSNIAQYILTSDLGLRVESCFLGGYLFKALLRASLPHPTADHDYALYEIGESGEAAFLIPGIDLLSEKFRADGRSLVAALRYVMDELHRSRHQLFMLPIVSLYLYFTSFVCRDLKRTVDGRILKIRVLTELKFFSEALVMLQRLLKGDRLPNSTETGIFQGDSRHHTARFNANKPILEPTNLKILDSIIDKRLSSNLGPLYGPHLTCQLTLVQAQLLIAIADSIPVLPKFLDVAPPGSFSYQAQSMATASLGERKFSVRHSLVQTKPQKKTESDNEASQASDEEESNHSRRMRRFAQGKPEPTLDAVKGSLLSAADQMLTTLSEIIIENAQMDKGLTSKEIRMCQQFGIHMTHKGIENLNAAELEVVVEAKLQMACIASQRHHSSMAARIILSAMTVLQRANILKDEAGYNLSKKYSNVRHEGVSEGGVSPVKIVDGKTTQYQFQNSISRSRLDARTWLKLRHALVDCLSGEMKGMGEIKGPDRAVKMELADVSVYCTEAIKEAEIAGDAEMQAEFISQQALLGILNGRSSKETIANLKRVLGILDQVRQLSLPGQLLRSLTLIHMTDLLADDDASNDLESFCLSQQMLLSQLEFLGESIEHRYDGRAEYQTVCAPVKNLMLPQLLPLVQVKLRIGLTLMKNAAVMGDRMSQDEAADLLTAALSVLTTALNLSRVIGKRIGNIEAEILFNMGKVQCQLFKYGKYNARTAGNTLLDAIKTSYTHDHDLGLIKEAYIELAVLYMNSAGLEKMPTTSEDGEMEYKPLFTADVRSQMASPMNPKQKGKKSERSTPDVSIDLEVKAAWVASRCAAAVGQSMRARSLLSGDASVNMNTAGLGAKAKSTIPDFLVLDLLGSYILGERKRIYKNEIEEEMAPLTEALDPPLAETYEDQIQKAREATNDLSWMHIIGYQGMLHRQIKFNGKDSEAEGFACSVLHSSPWALRLSHMHRFLTQCLPAYANDCSAIYPPVCLQLQPPADEFSCSVDIISHSYESNLSVPIDVDPEAGPVTAPPPPGAQEDLYRPTEKKVLEPRENELSFMWHSSPSANDIMLIYSAMVKPDLKPSGYTWLCASKLHDLREQLNTLLQHGEITIIEQKARKELSPSSASSSSVTSSKPGKKATRIRALSPKPTHDDRLQMLLKESLSQIKSLFGVIEQTDPAQDEERPVTAAEAEEGAPEPQIETPKPPQDLIPFDVTKANLRHLEHLFDLNYGHCMQDSKLLTWLLTTLS